MQIKTEINGVADLQLRYFNIMMLLNKLRWKFRGLGEL